MRESEDLKCFIKNLSSYKSVSIIGLEKNVGKTTTLNFLINVLKDKRLGITSIGRDGEKKDIVTSKDKPRIYINEGTVIATSKSSLLNSDVTFEILSILNVNTSIGEIVIAKSITAGFVEIAGPSIKNQIKEVIVCISRYNVDLTIIDGALSRKTFADPMITDAAILCIGAAFSEDVDILVEETVHLLSFLHIDEVGSHISRLYEENMTDSKLVFVYDKGIKKSSVKTSIGASKEFVLNFNKDLQYIFIKGIVTDSFITDILNSVTGLEKITFVVEDGTKIFISKDTYHRFLAKGGSIKAVNKIKVIGVSVNPVSPSGYILDYDELYLKLKREVKIPVFNVWQEEAFHCHILKLM